MCPAANQQNMVGFAAHGASVMFGCKESVATKVKKDVPNLFVVKCTCHSLALAVSYATKALPPYITTLLSDEFRYLKYSSKRHDAFLKFQKLLELPDNKILSFHKLRWLSLNAVVDRFVEQYGALFLYFEWESKSEVKKRRKRLEEI